MQEMPIAGDKIGTSENGFCTVEKEIGDGAQGKVYLVNYEGTPMALKWFFPDKTPKEHRSNLERIIKKGKPSDSFLWPEALITDSDIDSYGYIMPLYGESFVNLADLMRRNVNPSFKTICMAGFNLAHSFLQLHSKGLCYADINFGNVRIEPVTGSVQICDNDNCIFNGEKTSVVGTKKFMAPEIVTGKKNPNIQSDLFSLSVLLFYIFFIDHPLHGKKEADIHCLDDYAMDMLYGTDPVFIFDPDDDSNRPVPGYHENPPIFWDIYPQFIKDLFIKAFTKGIKDPEHGRVRETEWQDAMLRLHDSIICCSNCDSQNFYDVEFVTEDGKSGVSCWSCKEEVYLPPRIKINDKIIILDYTTKLYPHHIDKGKTYDFSKPTLELNEHPDDPDIWGLKNLTEEKWVVTTESGEIYDVEPGRSASLEVGMKINFGKCEGEIRV